MSSHSLELPNRFIITKTQQQEYYQAILDKDENYDGSFFIGNIVTGIFCLPSCQASNPQFKHCEFYKTAKEILLASFQPCPYCHPLEQSDKISGSTSVFVEAVEMNPTMHWRESDFENLSVNCATAQRQFKKSCDMTFVEYARSRRIGLAMRRIRGMDKAHIETTKHAKTFEYPYETSGIIPTKQTPDVILKQLNILKGAWLETKLGPMLAISDDNGLYLLEFVDRRGLERELERLQLKVRVDILPGSTAPIESIKQELQAYFDGSLKAFKTPLHLVGSPFQQRVWKELLQIPYGQTKTYAAQAAAIGNEKAYRAVASANGANQLAIVIPCHRIINSNGQLGGYGGGIERKQWLIEHETNIARIRIFSD